MTNYLKTVRKADTYIPAGENMAPCETGRHQREMAEASKPQKEGAGNSSGEEPRPIMEKRWAGTGCPHKCLCCA